MKEKKKESARRVSDTESDIGVTVTVTSRLGKTRAGVIIRESRSVITARSASPPRGPPSLRFPKPTTQMNRN